MLYIVIERFKDAPAIYDRLRAKGRMMLRISFQLD